MLGRIGTAGVLALLIGAIPTVVSLCELQCVAAESSPPEKTSASACAGHGEKEGQAPESAHQKCGGHVLLAKGGTPRIALQLDLAVVAALPSGSFTPSLDRHPDRLIFESAHLSPPSGRSPEVLRL